MLRKGLAVIVIAGLVLIATWAIPRIGVPAQFWLAPLESVSVGGRELRVARVDDDQGLRDADSLGALDAALFVLDRPASSRAGMGIG